MYYAHVLSGLLLLFFSRSLQEAPFVTGEWLVTVAWQWLTLAALLIWAGTLVAERQLLAACRGEQRAEVLAILRLALRRRQRQSWLWLSIILSGTLALFRLDTAHALPHQQFNTLPDWNALAGFLFNTPDGWLWLARGGLVIFMPGLLIVLSLTTWHQAHTPRRADHCSRSNHTTHRLHNIETQPTATGQSEHRTTMPGNRKPSVSLPPRDASLLASQRGGVQSLPVGSRGTSLTLIGVTATLLTFVLADPSLQEGPLPVTTGVLELIVFLALALWLGKVIYLAFVLAPATSLERRGASTQTLLELFSTIKPSLMQLTTALLLYGTFVIESRPGTHLPLNSLSLPPLLTLPVFWAFTMAAGFLLGIAALALYQKRRLLPSLVRMAWLATRGAFTPVLSGMDVSRSLQISQEERLALINGAAQPFIRSFHIQAALGVLLLLCLLIAVSLA